MKTPANLRILVMQNDLRMVELLRTGLSEQGHSVVTATTAEQGQHLLNAERFDAIVLDSGLPSGHAIAQRLRAQPHRPAIVMLAEIHPQDDIIHDSAADDYLAKPFSFPELIAQLNSAVRRARIATSDNFCFGPFRLDTRGRRLICNQTEIPVTRSEYLLLRELTLHRGEVVSRRQLMQAIWGTTFLSHGALDTLVNTLSNKLNAEHPELIAVARGTGYTLI